MANPGASRRQSGQPMLSSALMPAAFTACATGFAETGWFFIVIYLAWFGDRRVEFPLHPPP